MSLFKFNQLIYVITLVLWLCSFYFVILRHLIKTTSYSFAIYIPPCVCLFHSNVRTLHRFIYTSLNLTRTGQKSIRPIDLIGWFYINDSVSLVVSLRYKWLRKCLQGTIGEVYLMWGSGGHPRTLMLIVV